MIVIYAQGFISNVFKLPHDHSNDYMLLRVELNGMEEHQKVHQLVY